MSTFLLPTVKKNFQVENAVTISHNLTDGGTNWKSLEISHEFRVPSENSSEISGEEYSDVTDEDVKKYASSDDEFKLKKASSESTIPTRIARPGSGSVLKLPRSKLKSPNPSSVNVAVKSPRKEVRSFQVESVRI